jgi:hypothetical protein
MSKENLFTVPNLLSALIVVAGLTIGLFGVEAERAIGRLDGIEAAQSTVASSVAVITNRVDGLDLRVNAASAQLADHEKRIIVVEAKEAK